MSHVTCLISSHFVTSEKTEKSAPPPSAEMPPSTLSGSFFDHKFSNLKYLSSPTLQVCKKFKDSRYSGVAGVDLQLSSSWGNPVAVGQESGSIFQRNQTTFRPLSTLRVGEKKCFGILIQEKKVRGVFEQNIGNQDSSEDDDYNMAK